MWEKKKSLSNKWCSYNCISTCKKMKSGTILLLNTKINSKWIIDLKVRDETITFRTHGSNFPWPWIRKGVLRDETKSTSLTKKRLYQILKLSCFKWYHQESEKIMHKMGEKSANHLSKKGLASRTHKKTVTYYITLFKSGQSFLAMVRGMWKS